MRNPASTRAGVVDGDTYVALSPLTEVLRRLGAGYLPGGPPSLTPPGHAVRVVAMYATDPLQTCYSPP